MRLPHDGITSLPDGRTLAWRMWGDEGGRPLLRLHGTPGSRLARNPDPEAWERAGALVVTFDRPGYGGSTRDPNRTLLSAADDAVALADALGWDAFSVLGISGGGPHALAVGARAPERVRRLGLAVGGTPDDLIDEEDLIGFNAESRRRARQGRASQEEFLATPGANMMGDPVGTVSGVMKDAPPVDREMMERPEIQEMLVESMREAFRNGPQGWFDDAWVLSNEWDFQLRDVRVPVNLWYGELDRNVPLNAARKMAGLLQTVSFTVIPGVGHFGWILQEEAMLRTLLA